MRYLKDFTVGESVAIGPYHVTEGEMIDFAKRYDPQVFHVDPESPESQALGGLIASGWHTASIFMRMAVDAYMKDAAVIVSPGVDTLRWLHPVKAGDTLSGSVEIIEVRQSRSKPDRGIVATHAYVENQDKVAVLTMENKAFVRKSPL
ncbi:MaoC domain protein [Luminiphilus syltensis NOR5-1B]|uniref:MaoC domain protein n=1 Tax=Luminiphilus syltensis NOR5-1B TaxID=565045 RepID=B8KTB0_9GAMM|nr:MaoC family dehydratase [Luminiphilus syltensis]EED34792.1 MaoC domain protein [Luminiphilus syltensis NOR5-1B]